MTSDSDTIEVWLVSGSHQRATPQPTPGPSGISLQPPSGEPFSFPPLKLEEPGMAGRPLGGSSLRAQLWQEPISHSHDRQSESACIHALIKSQQLPDAVSSLPAMFVYFVAP